MKAPLARAKFPFERFLPPLLPLFFLIVLCEALNQSGLIRGFLLPAPSEVFRTLHRDSAELWRAAGSTGLSALLGFAFAALIGSCVAIALSSSRWVLRAFYPYAVFFQTVPIIAVAPILVIWFGYGRPTVVASAFIVSIFPVIANTLSGLQATDPALLDLFKLYGARGPALLFKLRLPNALPSILTGFRIASGLAVIGAIVGEFIAGGGLGGIVDVARNEQRVDKVFAAVLLASAIGLAFFGVINIVSRLALRHWHASELEHD